MRVISGDVVAILDSGRFHKRTLLAATLPSATVAFWDGVHDIDVGGITYQGAAGRFVPPSVPSIADQSVRGMDIVFSGLDADLTNELAAESYHQRPVTMAIAVMAADAPAVLFVVPVFLGHIDQIVVRETPGSGSDMIVRVESISREINRRGARTRSESDQRQINPDDGFFKHVTAAISTPIDWGRQPEQPQKEKKFFGLF